MKSGFEKKLAAALCSVDNTNPAHLLETQRLAYTVLETTARNKRPGMVFLIGTQLRYGSKSVWASLAIITALQIAWLFVYYCSGGLKGLPTALPFAMAAFGTMIAVPGAWYLQRSVQYGMKEIETSTLISMPRLLVARVVIAGLGTATVLVFLTIILGLVSSFSQIAIVDALFYYIFAYLMCSIGSMAIMDFIQTKNNLMYCILYCAFILCVITILFASAPFLFETDITVFHWGISGIVLTLLLAETGYMIKKNKKIDREIAL